MSKLICPTCGPITEAKIDGGSVMEHAFEGVYFKVSPAKKGLKVSFFDKDKNDDYFDDFNMKKLFKEMAEIADDGEYLECTKCGEDFTIDEEQAEAKTATVVLKSGATDLFTHLFNSMKKDK